MRYRPNPWFDFSSLWQKDRLRMPRVSIYYKHNTSRNPDYQHQKTSILSKENFNTSLDKNLHREWQPLTQHALKSRHSSRIWNLVTMPKFSRGFHPTSTGQSWEPIPAREDIPGRRFYHFRTNCITLTPCQPERVSRSHLCSAR